MLEFMVIEVDQLGVARGRMGNTNPYVAPVNTYRAKGDTWITFTASTQATVDRLFRVIGLPELSDDPRFKTNKDRVENRDVLDEILSPWFAERTPSEIETIFSQNGLPFAPILDAHGIVADEHYAAREAIVQVEDSDLGVVAMQGIVPKFSATPGEVRWTGPRRGEHNREIFSELLGIADEELTRLAAAGIITAVSCDRVVRRVDKADAVL
jgi:crotonobetainyl-CoA:carnitine CoA-transferase CaiB-like acyl-CoA transferase